MGCRIQLLHNHPMKILSFLRSDVTVTLAAASVQTLRGNSPILLAVTLDPPSSVLLLISLNFFFPQHSLKFAHAFCIPTSC